MFMMLLSRIVLPELIELMLDTRLELDGDGAVELGLVDDEGCCAIKLLEIERIPPQTKLVI